MILFALMLLSSCKESEKKESEILSDLNNSNYFASNEIVVNDIEILKRQTNHDTKTDKVWIKIVGESDLVFLSGDYTILYNLYNDGWTLDDIRVDNEGNYKVVPKVEPDIEEINTYISGLWSVGDKYTYVEHHCDLASGSAKYKYVIYFDDYEYFTKERSIYLDVKFNESDMEWKIDSNFESEDNIVWSDNLKGTWEYNKDGKFMRIIVSEIINVDRKVVCSFYMINKDGSISNVCFENESIDFLDHENEYIFKTYIDKTYNRWVYYIVILHKDGVGVSIEYDNKYYGIQYNLTKQ